MTQKLSLKHWLAALIVGAFLACLSAVMPLPAHADSIDHSVKCGVTFNLDGKGCATTAKGCEAQGGSKDECAKLGDPTSDLEGLIAKIVNILSVIVGVVAVIMIIVGGFKYITSGGDSNKVASAKNTIIYALVGVVIAALAQVIVKFVLGAVT